MVYSTVELLIPVGIHGTGSAFVVCLTGGPFYGKQNLRYAQLAVSIRCGFISLSYGILVIHFIYRYIALNHPKLVDYIFELCGILAILIFFMTHGVVWSTICETLLFGDKEMRDYIREEFRKVYKVDSYDVAFLGALYMEGSSKVRQRSWTGILILTGISVYAVSTYVFLGFKIMRKLRNNPALSPLTQNMHRQLLKALSIQTFIPICISFSPCMIAWYGPVLSLNLGMWNNYLGVIALSAFPFLDPLAIIFLLPSYRNRVLKWKMPQSNMATTVATRIFTVRGTTTVF